MAVDRHVTKGTRLSRFNTLENHKLILNSNSTQQVTQNND